jgi:hypothetical protein
MSGEGNYRREGGRYVAHKALYMNCGPELEDIGARPLHESVAQVENVTMECGIVLRASCEKSSRYYFFQYRD